MSFEDHINKLDKVIINLKQKDFKVNAEKSFFTRKEQKYLGFTITRQGIMLLPDTVDAIKSIAVSPIKKQVQVL